MTAETDLLPLPEIYRWYVTGDYAYPTEVHPEGGAVDYDAHVAAMRAYARANVAHATAPLQAEVEALRAEVERLNRILGRIVACDGDSTLVIRMGTDAFAAAREYLLRDQEEGHEQ